MTELGVVRRDRGAMPAPVILGLVALCFYEVLSSGASLLAGRFASVVVSAPIAALILVGVLRGHALAFRWGVIMPFVALLAVATSGDDTVIAMSCGVLLLAIPVSFSMPSSRRFFGLECPRCHATHAKPRDLFFNKRQCRACDTTWLE